MSGHDDAAGRRRAVVLCPLFPPAYLGGGPIRTLEAFVRRAPNDVEVSVVTSNVDLGETEPLDVPADAWVQLRPSARVRYVRTKSLRSVRRAIREIRAVDPDLIYLNGFFSAPFSIVPQLLRRCRVLPAAALVLAPRGEFGSGALALKSTKKRAYLLLYRALRLDADVTWHASSVAEAHRVRAVMGERSRVVVRENETDLPRRSRPVDQGDHQVLRAVHIARIVPIKGLDVLLRALADVREPISLDVYGPEEDAAHVARCRSIAAELPSHAVVRFLGVVEPAQVQRVLSAYDVMLLPTKGENFGHVIAESLSVSCPVMVPDTTPWTPTLRAGGGVVVEAGADSWTVAVSSYAARGREEWARARREAGRAYDLWRARSAAQPHLFELLELNGAERS